MANKAGEFPIGQKVVFFTTGMTAGGAERVIATLANALIERGFEVVIAMVKGDHSEYELAQGVRLRSANLAPGIQNLPRAIGFFRQLIRQETPDTIISFSTKSDIIALLTRILFRVSGRLIVSDRADPFTRDKWMQLACNTLYRWSDALVCQSHSVANYYSERLKRTEISVIANPIDEESIGVPSTKPRDPTVISVGRLSDQKNHRLAIEAFTEIRKVFPDLQLKIFGTGPLEAALSESIQRAHLEGSIALAGVVPNVIRGHENASLFLFTSNYEGYPNALLEAAATGIPIVTTDFSPGTASEIIDANVNGYIVPIGDRDALVAAAIKALSGALDCEDIVSASRRIREEHLTKHILKAWISVFLWNDASTVSAGETDWALEEE